MSTVAKCSLTLPPAPTQPIPQADRVVAITGAVSDGEVAVATQEQHITVFCDPKGTVTVQVQERLVNGQRSEPVSITFTPYNMIRANKATGDIIVDSVVLEEQPDPAPQPAQ